MFIVDFTNHADHHRPPAASLGAQVERCVHRATGSSYAAKRVVKSKPHVLQGIVMEVHCLRRLQERSGGHRPTVAGRTGTPLSRSDGAMLGGVFGGVFWLGAPRTGCKTQTRPVWDCHMCRRKTPRKTPKTTPMWAYLAYMECLGNILGSGKDAVTLFQIFQPQPGQQIQDHVGMWQELRSAEELRGACGACVLCVYLFTCLFAWVLAFVCCLS